MSIKNQQGSAIIGISVFMAVVAAAVYFYSTVQMLRVTREYRRTQSMAFAYEISAALATRLRWAYDIAASPGMCAQYNGNQLPVPGSVSAPRNAALPAAPPNIELCFTGPNPLAAEICVKHPAHDPTVTAKLPDICISFQNNTLVAKVSPVPGKMVAGRISRWPLAALLSTMALAKKGYAPDEPPAGSTNNGVNTPPVCENGSCDVICGTNADCLTYTFCPLMGGNCDKNEWITQTVAFFN